jgi:hypothetical protein
MDWREDAMFRETRVRLLPGVIVSYLLMDIALA